MKEQGLAADEVGVHDHKEPEASILLNRLKRQLKSMGRDPKDVDLVELTKARSAPVCSARSVAAVVAGDAHVPEPPAWAVS